MSAAFVYPVRLTRRIKTSIGWSSNDVQLHRIVQLTFAPYPGLEISADGEFSAQIKEVVYDVEAGAFECWCGDRSVWDSDELRGSNGIAPTATVDEVKQRLANEETAQGWVVKAD